MNYYKLKITSKNKESLMYFYNFLFCKNEKLQKNFFIIKKHYKSFHKTKKLTILKAPHVYKVAQEQFKSTKYSETFLIGTTNYLKLLKFIKYLKTSKISDLSIILKKFPQKNQLHLKSSITLTNFILYYFNKNVKYSHFLKKPFSLIFDLKLIKNYLIQAEVLHECRN